MNDQQIQEEYEQLLLDTDPSLLTEEELGTRLEIEEQMGALREANQKFPGSDIGGTWGALEGAAVETAKGLDVVGAPARAGAAKLLEQLTGKDVYREGELADHYNPTKAQIYPDFSELMKRSGVSRGANLSDYLPGYSEPSWDSPWYMPEKGGALDPSMRGAVGTALDMVTDLGSWATLGASGVTKKALQKTASQRALRGEGPSALTKLTAMMGKPLAGKGGKFGDLVNTTFRLPSRMLSKAGETMYGASLAPIEFQGKAFGKPDVPQTFFNAGIATSGKLQSGAKSAIEKLTEFRNRILKQADNAGGAVKRSDVRARIQPEIERLRASKIAENQPIADALEEALREQEDLLSGVKSGKKQTPFLEGIDPESARPRKPKELDVSGSSSKKSAIYNQTGGSAYSVLNDQNKEVVNKILAKAEKDAGLDVVGKVINPAAVDDVNDLNKNIGDFLSTKKAQHAAEKSAESTASSIPVSIAATGALSSVSPNAGRWGAAAAIGNMLRSIGQPVGYGIKKLADDPTVGSAMDNYLRNQYIDLNREE